MKKMAFLKIKLKKADFSDIEFLWYLRNQPYVYERCRVDRKVEWKEHINWIMPVLLGLKKQELFIIEFMGKKVGQIRFDYEDNEAGVSISLLKEFHGKGIAVKSLKLAIRLAQKKGATIRAEINKNNLVSIRFFEKLKFVKKSQKGDWLQYVLNIKN